MPKGMSWVGLDVHAHASTAAVLDGDTGEVVTRGLPGRPHELLGFLRELSPPFRAVYEAGPTGGWACPTSARGGVRRRRPRARAHRAAAG
jgi:hypothetical protein